MRAVWSLASLAALEGEQMTKPSVQGRSDPAGDRFIQAWLQYDCREGEEKFLTRPLNGLGGGPTTVSSLGENGHTSTHTHALYKLKQYLV